MNDLSLEKVMTVKEVSEAIGAPIRTVHNAIDRVFPGLKQNGKTTYLTEIQVAEISKELKRSHNIDLASTRKVATTDIELIERSRDLIHDLTQRVIQAERENKALSAENAVMTPKAEFFDQVTGSRDAIDMAAVAKVLNAGIGRNKLFSYLRQIKVLQPDNQPYQRFIDAGYFRVIEQKYTKPTGEVCISLKTVVYQKGLDYIRKELTRGC